MRRAEAWTNLLGLTSDSACMQPTRGSDEGGRTVAVGLEASKGLCWDGRRQQHVRAKDSLSCEPWMFISG